MQGDVVVLLFFKFLRQNIPGYLVSFLTLPFLWPGVYICIGGFETKSLPNGGKLKISNYV